MSHTIILSTQKVAENSILKNVKSHYINLISESFQKELTENKTQSCKYRLTNKKNGKYEFYPFM